MRNETNIVEEMDNCSLKLNTGNCERIEISDYAHRENRLIIAKILDQINMEGTNLSATLRRLINGEKTKRRINR